MDLFRASERLAQQKEINHDRYEVDLAIWKVESRIELLSARLKMAGRDSPEGESLVAQLRKLLEERHNLRAERLAHDRQKLAERLEKIDRQLETMRANREQNIERDLRRFVDPPRPTSKPKSAKKAS
jgi:DNA anti-recombination protein RmuC